jgi:uncharacterized protein (TIRG00374 family)
MRRAIITLTKIALSVLVLWFLAHTAKLNFSLLPQLLDSPQLLVGIISLYLVVILLSAWRWYQLNTAQGIQLPFSRTIVPTYLGVAFNNLLPGGVGGDFFRCYFLFKKMPNKRSAMMLSILFDRLTGLLGIFIAVCFIAISHINFFNPQKSTYYFLLFCALLCIGTLTLFFASSLLPQRIGLSTWLSRRFAGKKWLQSVLSFLDAIRIYRNSKLVIVKSLAASIVIQVIIANTCILIAKAMHFPSLDLFDYIIAIAVTQIVNLIPITPGGFGIGEAAFANILTLLNPGISATYATIFLAYRIIGILTYLPGVGIFLFDRHLLKQENSLAAETT